MPKKKLNIAIDIDDVQFDFVGSLIKYFNREYKCELARSDITSYMFSQIIGKPVPETMIMLEKFWSSPECDEMPPVEGAVETIRGFIDKGYNVISLTARVEEFARDKTLKANSKYFGDAFKKVIFAKNHYAGCGEKTKREICAEEGIDVFIDDNIDYAVQCASPKRKVLLFSNENTRWNHFPIPEQHMFYISRVATWKGIELEVARVAEAGVRG